MRSHDPPERPVRYVAACSNPPVPVWCTAVVFLPSNELSAPVPNKAARYPPPETAMPSLGNEEGWVRMEET